MKKLLLALCLILTLLFTLTSTPVKAQTNEIPSLSSVTLTIEDFPTTTYGIWRKCGNQKLSQIQQFWSELSKVEVGTKPTNVFCFGYSPKRHDDPSIQVISGFTQILLSEEKAAFDNRLKLRQEQEGGGKFAWNDFEWSDFAWNKEQIDDNKKFLSQEIIEAFRRGNVGVLISQAYKSDAAPLIYEIDKAFNNLDKRIVDIYTQIETAKLFENSESEPELSQSQTQPNLLSKPGQLLLGASPVEKTNSTPTKAQQQQKCEPSYPNLCIPADLPDLNCSDITYRRFKVLPPDTYGFDRDGDEIGCER